MYLKSRQEALINRWDDRTLRGYSKYRPNHVVFVKQNQKHHFFNQSIFIDRHHVINYRPLPRFIHFSPFAICNSPKVL